MINNDVKIILALFKDMLAFWPFISTEIVFNRFFIIIFFCHVSDLALRNAFSFADF